MKKLDVETKQKINQYVNIMASVNDYRESNTCLSLIPLCEKRLAELKAELGDLTPENIGEDKRRRFRFTVGKKEMSYTREPSNTPRIKMLFKEEWEN